MPTPTEKRIIQQRRAEKSGDVLVPILEELLENECRPEDEEDFRFLAMLARARARPREQGVFSPSMLGSCIRQAYFAKTGEEKHRAPSVQSNGYFLKGDFVHFQWQFALWKAHRKGLLDLVKIQAEHPSLALDSIAGGFGGNTRPAVEVRVRSSTGDFAGTIDAIIIINGTYYIVDFKGIMQISFNRHVKKGADESYQVQIVGYAMILNGSAEFHFTVKKCLLVVENKAGPVSGTRSPLALHETIVDVDDYKSEVRSRLKRLRDYVAKKSIPPPACVSTRHQQYQECPFNRFCEVEVKRIQRENEKKAQARVRGKQWEVNRIRR